jgi:hypothetical protein
VESAPFGFRREKRAGSLEEIVSVYSDVPNFLAKVINLGDVIIDTLNAPRAYTFESVPDPIAMQKEIFSQLNCPPDAKRWRTILWPLYCYLGCLSDSGFAAQDLPLSDLQTGDPRPRQTTLPLPP